MSAEPELLYEVRDGIGRITFNRPQARNALTFAMYARLAEICQAVEHDPAVKVLLITGAGEKAFAAGTDIGQFRAFSTPQDALDYESKGDRVLTAVEKCVKPTIAAIAGACTGGGAAIAGVCDIRIAAANMRYGFPIARTLGNCLSMSNYARLSGLLGAALTKEIIFTSRLIEADEAKRIGLVSEVLPDAAALAERADALAKLVASQAPLTMRATKEAFRRLKEKSLGTDDMDRDLILMCYMSADFREGMEAFLTKRPPVWTGK